MERRWDEFDGTLLRRGEEGYEAARRGAVWNARTPERYPEAIVLAASEADAVAGVRLARREGLTVTVRSGGHSWAGNHLRDGSVLLDLSALRGHEVDEDAMTARCSRAAAATSCSPRSPSASSSSPRATARASASAATCCRAATAGTGACTARPA